MPSPCPHHEIFERDLKGRVLWGQVACLHDEPDAPRPEQRLEGVFLGVDQLSVHS